MCSTNGVNRSGLIVGLAVLILTTVASTGRAQWYVPESVGGRGGFSLGGLRTADFTEADAFATWNLPWKLESEHGWFLDTKLTLWAGFLGGNGISSGEGTIAPAVGLGKRHFPVSFEGGIGPTFISEYRYGSINFGQQLQFTSFAGINVDLTPHWRVGARLQHMSNGGLAKSNPGLNLIMFGVGYVF